MWVQKLIDQSSARRLPYFFAGLVSLAFITFSLKSYSLIGFSSFNVGLLLVGIIQVAMLSFWLKGALTGLLFLFLMFFESPEGGDGLFVKVPQFVRWCLGLAGFVAGCAVSSYLARVTKNKQDS